MVSSNLRLLSLDPVVSRDHWVAWVSGSHSLPRHSPQYLQKNGTIENQSVRNQFTPSVSRRSQRLEKVTGSVASRTRPLKQGRAVGGSKVATASATLVAPSADTCNEVTDSASAGEAEVNIGYRRERGQGDAVLIQDESSVALETLYRLQTSAHVSEPPLSPYSAVFGKGAVGYDFPMDSEGRKTSGRTKKDEEAPSAMTSHDIVAPLILPLGESIPKTIVRKRSTRRKAVGLGEESADKNVQNSSTDVAIRQESVIQAEIPVKERKTRSRRKVKLDSVADEAVDLRGSVGNSVEESVAGSDDGGIIGETFAEVPTSESGLGSGLTDRTSDTQSGGSDSEGISESKSKDEMSIKQGGEIDSDEVLISFGDTKKLNGKRQRRLSLNSRIQLREGQVAGQQSTLSRRVTQKWAGIRLPPAAGPMGPEDLEEFVSQNGRLRSSKPGWGSQKRSSLLTAAEEVQLGNLMQAFKPAQQTRIVLEGDLGRAPTDEEWARACSVPIQVLKRQMEVYDAARNKLLTSNLGFIFRLANKYSSMQSKLSIPELEQLGVEGLMNGVDRWDPNRNIRFSTYVGFWIRTAMLRPIGKYGYLLRGPSRIQQLHQTQRIARQELTVKFGRPPTIEELAARQNISAARCRQIMQLWSQGLSLNQLDRVSGQELISQLRAEEEVGRDFQKPHVRFLLDDVLDTLKPRESLVIRQRFGFDGKAGQSLREIGKNLGVTYECARQWEKQGLGKMRQSAIVEYLRENVLEL